MGDFEKDVVSMFADMPSYKVSNVFLRILGRQINRFDNNGDNSISKSDLVEMVKEAVDHENNPRTAVERILNRNKCTTS